MNVLILGGGGREHALYEKIKLSPLVNRVFGAPGNAGFSDADRINIPVTDFPGIEKIVREQNISLLVVGPEGPLVSGIRDQLKSVFPQLKVFGPDAISARLEGSKEFACNFMRSAGIPFADTRIAHSFSEAKDVLASASLPVVLKADGLAGGKGVSIHAEKQSALEKLSEIFEKSVFGEAGKSVLFQRYLTGKEASLFALCNGTDAIYLPAARDYKRVFDNDEGDNTGGMGAVCPGMTLNEQQIAWCHEHVSRKVLEKFSYRGLLYIGLMIHSDQASDISVIEFNCRFGDPETQSVLPMVADDIVPYFLWCDNDPTAMPLKVQKSGYFEVPVHNGSVLNVTVAATGYPKEFRKQIPIRLPENKNKQISVIHASTEKQNDALVSTSGRVLNITCRADTAQQARETIYQYLAQFETLNEKGAFHYRTDIGK